MTESAKSMQDRGPSKDDPEAGRRKVARDEDEVPHNTAGPSGKGYEMPLGEAQRKAIA